VRPGRRKKQDWKRLRLLWKRRLLFLALTAFFCCLILLPLQIKIWGMEKELLRLRREEQAVLQKQQEIRQELEFYESDAFVEEAARRDLGLVKPGETLVVPAVPGRVQSPPKDLGRNPYRD